IPLAIGDVDGLARGLKGELFAVEERQELEEFARLRLMASIVHEQWPSLPHSASPVARQYGRSETERRKGLAAIRLLPYADFRRPRKLQPVLVPHPCTCRSCPFSPTGRRVCAPLGVLERIEQRR